MAHLRALLSNVCHNYNTPLRGAHSQHTSSTFNHLNCFLFVYKVLSASGESKMLLSKPPGERERKRRSALHTHTQRGKYTVFFCQVDMNKYERRRAQELYNI